MSAYPQTSQKKGPQTKMPGSRGVGAKKGKGKDLTCSQIFSFGLGSPSPDS